MKKRILLFLVFIMSFVCVRVSALTCEDGEFIVNYNANKGKMKLTQECVSDILTSIKPTRSGYAFLGWSKSKSGSTPEYASGSKIELNSKTTLYAVWSKGIKLSFNGNGGKTSKKSKTVYRYLTYGSMPSASKKGYTFLGWYTKKSGGTKVDSNTIVSSSKKFTVYAHYQKINYKINYELNGGLNNSKNKSSYNITTKTFSLSNPSRKGYTFSGWYTNNKYKSKVTKIKKGSTGNKTYYAKWTPIKYNIAFNGNGSTSGKMTNQKNMVYDKIYTLKTNTYSKKGYVFAGWNTKKDGSGTTYNDKQVVVNLLSSNNKTITLYAMWSKPQYKINYELDGGYLENGIISYTEGYNYELNNPTKEGYIFDGWFLEYNFINRIVNIDKNRKGDLTLYAKWKKLEEELTFYTITYELNGGVNNIGASTTFTEKDEIILLSPTKDNYKFIGWYTDEDFSNKITKIETGTKENIIVYAKWEQIKDNITYNINYVLNGGLLDTDIYTYTSEYSQILPIPQKDGYEFDGWYTDENFTYKVSSIAVNSTGDKTFYAHWVKEVEELIQYNINYELDEGVLLNKIDKYTIESEITLPIPEKDGYEFDGWYTDNKYTNKITKIEKGTTGDITLYAKFNKIEIIDNNYNIIYHLNGGVNNSENINTFTENDEVILLDPTKDGYDFIGWYKDNEFKNEITKIEKNTKNNIDLYAKWKFITKRNYNYIYYKNVSNYNISNQDDIKNAIYTGLNSGNNEVTLECKYEVIENCINDFLVVFKDNSLLSSISNYVSPYNKYYNVNSSFTYNSKEGHITLTFNKKYSEEQIKEIDEVIDNNLNQLNINEMSEEEKIKWAHDYLVNKNSYDLESMNTGVGNAYNAYGALIENKAVCQGYAEAMALLLDRFNIPNLMVSSDTHVWNLIYINNEWKHLDATWDDPVTSNGTEVLLYDYYLITSDELSKLDEGSDHTYNNSYYLETSLN